MKATEWAFERVKEAFELVAQDEARKVSIVQEIMFKSTDTLRRIIAPVGGQGGVPMSYLCPHCNSFPLEGYILVGLWGKTYKLVVCDLWRKIRLEAIEHALGGANRRKCQPGQGLQSACSTSGPMRNLINDKIKEAFELVAQDEAEKVRIVQEIMLKSTDKFWRIIAPVGGQGGVTMSYLCPNCNSFPWKTTFGGSLGKNIQIGGVQFVERNTIGSNRTGF